MKRLGGHEAAGPPVAKALGPLCKANKRLGQARTPGNGGLLSLLLRHVTGRESRLPQVQEVGPRPPQQGLGQRLLCGGEGRAPRPAVVLGGRGTRALFC